MDQAHLCKLISVYELTILTPNSVRDDLLMAKG